MTGDPDERLDRAISRSEITNLVAAYAVAVDSRDLDALVRLFVDDVRVRDGVFGRVALRAAFESLLSRIGPSIHLVGSVYIDFDDADHASGIVHCSDELAEPQGTRWRRGRLQYWDDYERRSGTWLFVRREFRRWYVIDDEALSGSDLLSGRLGRSGERRSDPLPYAYHAWDEWESARANDPTAADLAAE